jgi:hypothetical protein
MPKIQVSSRTLKIVFAVTAISMLFLVTSSLLSVSYPYGFTLNVSPDPLMVPIDGSGTIQAYVQATKVQVFFSVYIDDVLVAHDYGTQKVNVVELDVPVQGSDYRVGIHTINVDAVVDSNSPFSETAQLYIFDPNGTPISEITPIPTVSPSPTVTPYSPVAPATPTCTLLPLPTLGTPGPNPNPTDNWFINALSNFWHWLTHGFR